MLLNHFGSCGYHDDLGEWILFGESQNFWDSQCGKDLSQRVWCRSCEQDQNHCRCFFIMRLTVLFHPERCSTLKKSSFSFPLASSSCFVFLLASCQSFTMM